MGEGDERRSLRRRIGRHRLLIETAGERAALEAEWLKLTRERLPALATVRNWPVSADHCFMRILLDAVHGRRWDDLIPRRPAYRHIEGARLAEAVALARAVAAGDADLRALNAQSLSWRGKQMKRHQR
jgi:hypothetical protein